MKLAVTFFATVFLVSALVVPAWADSSSGGAPGSGMLPSGTNSLTGKFTQPPCPITESGGAVPIAANACAASSSDGTFSYWVVLAAGANTLPFPTGLNASGGQTINLILNQPSGSTPATLTPNAGWVFPTASLSSGQIVLSSANSLVDEIICHSMTSTSMPGLASYAQAGLLMDCPMGVVPVAQ